MLPPFLPTNGSRKLTRATVRQAVTRIVAVVAALILTILAHTAMAADPLGLPASSFPPLSGSPALETQNRITLEAALKATPGYRAEVSGQLGGAAGADGRPIRLIGSASFIDDNAGNVAVRIAWTRLSDKSTLTGVLISRARVPRGTTIAAGTTLTIVGDLDALHAGVQGFAASVDGKIRGGCPDLVHYSRGVVVAQTRSFGLDTRRRTTYTDCSPDAAAGLWRIERDYRGCDWQPGEGDRVYPSYRLVYRPYSDSSAMIQLQTCIPDQQKPGPPFGITIGGCSQVPNFNAAANFNFAAGVTTATGATTAAQRYGWTTPDGVFRGLTPCLDPIPVTLKHQARACPSPVVNSSNSWDNPSVPMSEILVQTDAGANTYRLLLPCGPWGLPEGAIEQDPDPASCAGKYYDDMVGGVSYPMVRYGVSRQGGGESASSVFTPVSNCLPDPSRVIRHDERRVGWHHADGVLASFPVMQRIRDGADLGPTYIGDPPEPYKLETDSIVAAGAPEVVGCVSFQAWQRVQRYRRPDNSTVDIYGPLDKPSVTDNCGR